MTRETAGQKAPAQEDETLDLVRLLVETETRHAQTKAQASEEEADTPRKKTAPKDPNIALAASQFEPLQADPLVQEHRASKPALSPRLEGFAQKALGQGAEKLPPREEMTQYFKLAGLVAVALILLFKPWVLPFILFVVIWLSLILFLLLGSARIGELVNINWGRYERRRPEKAKRVLGVMQRAADRADGFLARLPERWADGIYTPDLGRSNRDIDEERLMALKGDPFDRLAREREREAGAPNGNEANEKASASSGAAQ